MSDHDSQLLMISTDYSHVPIHKSKTVRKLNKYTLSDFIDKLSCELWDSFFNSEDVNAMFNSFLNTYLRIFYSSFPLKKVINRNNNDNNWITVGIKTCRQKRELYFTCRNSNNPELNRHYQVYCKILSNVIKEAGWVFGVGLTTPHIKKVIVTKVEQRKKLDECNDDGESWWQIGKNGRILLDRPKPTAGCSANGRRRRIKEAKRMYYDRKIQK
jgi:hypothetical protein